MAAPPIRHYGRQWQVAVLAGNHGLTSLELQLTKNRLVVEGAVVLCKEFVRRAAQRQSLKMFLLDNDLADPCAEALCSLAVEARGGGRIYVTKAIEKNNFSEEARAQLAACGIE